VGEGGDALHAFAAHEPLESREESRYVLYRVEGPSFERVLERVEALIPKNATFVAIPEGVMLNYLSRRRNPTPYLSFFPPEMAVWGEDNALAALEARRPDFVLVVERSILEYGGGRYGERAEFGAAIMEWVNENYAPIEAVRQPPPADKSFGVTFMARRDAAPGRPEFGSR